MTADEAVPDVVDSSRPTIRRCVFEGVLLVVLMSAVGLTFNGLRGRGLEVVAQEPHQVLMPCPEPGGPVNALQSGDPALLSQRTFLVDARPQMEFEAQHVDGAVNLPFDWLDPVPEDQLMQLADRIATSRATKVAVYGDGGRPDSGEHLGKEISGRGIKNVFFVAGGAPALIGSEQP